MTQTKTIKPYEAYAGMSDGDVVAVGIAVQTAMTGSSNYQNSPVDLAVFKTDIDTLLALMAEAQDGSRKIIAEKNNQRDVVVKKLRMLGRYVEFTCKDDMAIFKSSGFEPAASTRTQPQGLSDNIRSIQHGVVTGQIVIRLKAVSKALSYELRYGADNNGGTPPAWTIQLVTGVRTPVTLTSLTPGTNYAFQVRSLGKSGYSDWSDSVTFMCT